MFIQGGNPLSTSTMNMPWFKDDTFSYIQPKIQLNFTSAHASSNSIYKHPQIESMLYLIKHFNTQLSFKIRHSSVNYNSDTIQYLKENQELPDQLSHIYDFDKNTIGFAIIESKKYNQQLFPALDKIIPDEKALSMSLMENVNHKIRIYKKENYYVILTSQWTWDMARKLTGLLPKLFPQIQLPENFLNLFKIFGTGHPDEFNTWVTQYNTWIQSFNIIEAHLKELFVTAISSQKIKRIKDTKKRLDSTINDIENYMNALRDLQARYSDITMQLFGYENAPEESVEDLYTYLKKNKSIANFKISGNTLELLIRTPWVYFELNIFEKIVNNASSNLRKNYPNLAKFFRQVFSQKPVFELWTDTIVRVNLEQLTFERGNEANCQLLPQTHIHRFNCWGNNNSHIQKALGKSDFIGAIEQIIAAAKNLNWYDNPVTNELFNYLNNYYHDIKTIKYLKTDAFISYKQALQIIAEEEKKANEVHQDNPTTATINNGEIPTNAPTGAI